MVTIPNGKTLKKALAMMSTSFLLWCLAAGMVSADGMASAETPIAMNIKVDAKDAANEVLSFDIKAGEVFKVELYAAGGTGYEWVLLNKDLQLIEVVSSSTGPAMETPNLVGGKMRSVYILQAKSDTAGQETVVFSLRRSWEPANMAAKTINCEVNVR
ncbi:MAG: protease inhibitor I42 family protein [Veillonellales bacterium]